MRVSVNVKMEVPEEMTPGDFADCISKAFIDFSIKTKCNLEKWKITELKAGGKKHDQD